MVFKNMEEQDSFTLRNQERELRCFGTEEIEDFLEDMLVTPDQFVVLTAPKAQKQIRYVQACLMTELWKRNLASKSQTAPICMEKYVRTKNVSASFSTSSKTG